jgi:hypothetical protein
LPGTFCARTAPGIQSAAKESARMVTFIVCSCCTGCP